MYLVLPDKSRSRSQFVGEIEQSKRCVLRTLVQGLIALQIYNKIPEPPSNSGIFSSPTHLYLYFIKTTRTTFDNVVICCCLFFLLSFERYYLNLIDIHIPPHDGVYGQGGDTLHAELLHDVLVMGDDSRQTDVQLVGNFLVDIHLHNQ